MSKSLTWGTCLDYTVNNRDTWRNGGGRKSALHYSGLMTEAVGRSFPAIRIDKGLMSRECVALEERGMTNAGINRFISAVQCVLNFCKEDKVITFELDTPFRRRKEEESTRKFYTKEQVREMVSIARTQFLRDDLADFIQFQALTGMRLGETLNLPAEWVNFSSNLIELQKCKHGKARNIPIHPELLPILEKRCEFTKPKIKVFGDEWDSPDQLRRAFYNVTRRYMGLGIDYTIHSLRHSFGTWCFASNVPPRDVMEMMGHSNLTTTLIYGKSTNESQQKHLAALSF